MRSGWLPQKGAKGYKNLVGMGYKSREWVTRAEACIPLCAVTRTEMIKSPVHDARLGGVDALDLVTVERPGWQGVVVVMPAFKPQEPDFGPAAK